MSDPIRRAIRTFVQTFLGAVITSGVLSAASTTGVVDYSALKKVLIAALIAGVVAVITYVQNTLEEASVVPGLLKSKRATKPSAPTA